jgi:hypothetical protein
MKNMTGNRKPWAKKGPREKKIYKTLIHGQNTLFFISFFLHLPLALFYSSFKLVDENPLLSIGPGLGHLRRKGLFHRSHSIDEDARFHSYPLHISILQSITSTVYTAHLSRSLEGAQESNEGYLENIARDLDRLTSRPAGNADTKRNLMANSVG